MLVGKNKVSGDYKFKFVLYLIFKAINFFLYFNFNYKIDRTLNGE